ncbi:MAG: hypothetical protein ACOC8I_03740 [Desulfosalsimonas sp.]
MAVVLHPWIIRRARTIAENMKNINSRREKCIAWIRWVRWLGLQAWHEDGLLLSSKTDIWLFDEGIVHYLRKTTGPLPMQLLENCPMPHMVVNINTDKVQAAWRRVLRTNHNSRYEIVDKDTCGVLAGKYCLNFLRERGIDETREFLQKWSAKFCREPLSDTEIDGLIEKTKQKLQRTGTSKAGPRNNWLRPALENLGVVWIDIDTSDGNPPEKTAAIVAEQIWKHNCRARQIRQKGLSASRKAK